MSNVSMFFGVVLMALGGGLYFASETRAITALIPAFFGVAFVVLGAIARNDAARKHAMHVAAMLGLIGCVFPAYRVVSAVVAGTELGLAHYGQIAMAALCAVFVALCVKSFIDSRKERKAKETQAA